MFFSLSLFSLNSCFCTKLFEEECHEEKKIDDVPEEIIVNILDFIDVREFHQLCKFMSLSKKYRLITEKYITRIDLFPYKNKVNDNVVEKIVKNFPNIKFLILANCNKITNESLKEISKLKNLEELNIACCHFITDNGLKSIRNLEKLNNLYLFYCSKITKKSLKIIDQDFKNLTDLNLVFCEKITKKSIFSMKRKEIKISC
jgi:Leucine-rich repeat (LRR) protein